MKRMRRKQYLTILVVEYWEVLSDDKCTTPRKWTIPLSPMFRHYSTNMPITNRRHKDPEVIINVVTRSQLAKQWQNEPQKYIIRLAQALLTLTEYLASPYSLKKSLISVFDELLVAMVPWVYWLYGLQPEFHTLKFLNTVCRDFGLSSGPGPHHLDLETGPWCEWGPDAGSTSMRQNFSRHPHIPSSPWS